MDKHYDIGVIGWWHNSNYGSMLTYYALHQTLKKLGYSVLMIHEALGYETGRIKWNYENAPHRFAKVHYDFTEQVHYNELIQYNGICDAFIVGSDQLWNPHIGRVNSDCFLDFTADDKKRISYGTSFGNVGVLESSPNFVKKNYDNLRRFDAVSVREDYAVKAAMDNFKVKAVRVVDPVFLPDITEYLTLAEQAENKIDGEYLLAFILDPTEKKKNIVAKLADKLGYKKIFILTDPFQSAITKAEHIFNETNMEMFTLEQISPENFLCAYRNAAYVVTDSFHGTCFSYIFRKDFNVFYNILRGADRFVSIVGLLGLENRRIYEDGHTEPDTSPIDYSASESNINQLRDYSLNWLKKSLKTPKENLPSILYYENVKKVLDKKMCTGCSACNLVCPAKAITMQENREGFLNPVIDNSKCVYCGLCVKKCVSENTSYKNNSQPKCYAVQADDEIRKMSSSGGMFTVAANYIIDKGGYVCGAAYKDNFRVEHIIVDNKNDLYKLRGSKYMQSNSEKIYEQVKDLLGEDKTVLFTGLPCQVAGMYSYLGKDYDNFYTIDLVCHGITSSKVFEKYHKDVLDNRPLQRLEFKAKEPWGWHAGLNAYFTDGTKYSVPCESDPYFIAYLNSVSKNITCGSCTVNRLPRQGDLTMGDFWGIEHDSEMNDKKGTSLVLINNEKAQRFFDDLKQSMKEVKEEPLQMALNGNHSIELPYSLNKNRNLFFEKFDELDFSSLINACMSDILYRQQRKRNLETLPKSEHSLYYLAEAAAKYSKGREIVTWAKSPKFEEILLKYFNLKVSFSIAKGENLIDNLTVFPLTAIKDGPSKFYVVSIHASYNISQYDPLTGFGFQEITDFIYHIPKPIVITNFDCSKGKYEDYYGNKIEGKEGVVSKVVFKGCNNHIVLGKNIRGLENISFNMTTNCYTEIGNDCLIHDKIQIEFIGYNGNAKIQIGNMCRFAYTLFRLYANPYTSSISIEDNCTFEQHVEFHANSGKKIKIGRDCMFSHGIDLWSGDGHSIFDVNNGKNINSIFKSQTEIKNSIVIGDHVWVGKGAFILHGTVIGNGSIIGAKSVVKGEFPNNCSIAGNPAKMIKKDVAWSRNNISENILDCGEYASLTQLGGEIEKEKIMNWLVTGGSTGLGKQFVLKLCSMGYTVAATSRDISKLNDLPDNVIKIQLDVRDMNSCQKAINTAMKQMGRIDVLVNNAGLSHTSAFEETPSDIGDNIIETNYWGTANMIKLILPYMRRNGNGTVINISSASGFRPRNYGSYYVASKFAVDSLTKNLKYECRRFMRFMAVELGAINTGLMQRQSVIKTTIDEYKMLPEIYPYKGGYRNRIDKSIEAIINVANQKEIPRELILGWDAYQQFQMVIRDFEQETEKNKPITITTDVAKKGKIKLEDIVLPRNEKLKIQTWLITGASGGFGKSLALRLIELGYTVCVTSRDISKLVSYPDNVYKIESQLDSAEACEKVVKTAIEKMGTVDVLVNNATCNCWSSYEECSYDIMRNVFYVNFSIAEYMIKALLPYMRKNKNGTVVNLTSIAAIQPRARVQTYSAAKAALEGLTRVLKSECQRFGRFMAVELVCMGTDMMLHNPVIKTEIPEYQNLGLYTPGINNIPNRHDISAQQIINVVNQDKLPQTLLIGTESYLIAKNEIKRARKDYNDYKDITLSVCEKVEKSSDNT
ncbi:MAG: SDR family NAD(P)-dependent oxidoreductase [bacterium]|nr:SDR family NAD(P)-dependent oxidoreductase [bacterium]